MNINPKFLLWSYFFVGCMILLPGIYLNEDRLVSIGLGFIIPSLILGFIIWIGNKLI